MTDRELMERALVALEMEAKGHSGPHKRLMPVIYALTERLKEPDGWKSLTDEEARAVNFQKQGICYVYPSDWEDVGLPFVRAIEAKLREKNVTIAQPKPEQEPEPPSDENITDAWVSASDSDGIAYDGPSFERGYRLGRGEYDEYTEALVADALAVHKDEINHLKDLLGKSNALCRIRQAAIKELTELTTQQAHSISLINAYWKAECAAKAPTERESV